MDSPFSFTIIKTHCVIVMLGNLSVEMNFILLVCFTTRCQQFIFCQVKSGFSSCSFCICDFYSLHQNALQNFWCGNHASKDILVTTSLMLFLLMTLKRLYFLSDVDSYCKVFTNATDVYSFSLVTVDVLKSMTSLGCYD